MRQIVSYEFLRAYLDLRIVSKLARLGSSPYPGVRPAQVYKSLAKSASLSAARISPRHSWQPLY